MIVREIRDDSTLLVTQEDHAELSAQFAAHWGNRTFSRPRPYESIVFATLYHDSGYREWEGLPPLNLREGRPYGHREDPPSFEHVELEGYVRNIDWVKSHDRYAGLLVSMHRTGLWQNRYQTMGLKKATRERSTAIQALIKQLEISQDEEKRILAENDHGFVREVWFNYQLLQVYDILSLYFCCNGYDGDHLKEDVIGPIPVNYDANEEANLHIVPIGPCCVRINPYPFDISPLSIAVRARTVLRRDFVSDQECMETYFKAPRTLLNFQLTN
jgi:hypothetical protein